jgi:hypothetical protein
VTDIRVNTFASDWQTNPAVAMDGAGNFVVTWQSSGQDGSGYGIYAQRYNAAGVAVGSEFRVNTFTTDNQRLPAVAMDGAGNFVVTWQSYGQDGSGLEIYAQRYDAAGVAVGSEFRVNTFTTGHQSNPAVAVDGAGDFVVTWQSDGHDGSSEPNIYAQRYTAAGVAVGSEFRVSTFTPGAQQNPAVAMDSAGNFVVTWMSDDGSADGIYLRRFAGESVPLPQLAISGPAPLPEGNAGDTPFTFTVTRSGSTTGNSSVNWAVSGTGANPASAFDFAGGVLPSGTLTFAAGANSKTITVTVQSDVVVEPDEDFLVTISGATGATIATATAEGVIVDDDVAFAIAALAGDLPEGNAGGAPLVFTVMRSGITTGTSSVNWAVSGTGANPASASDFAGGVLPSGSLTFAAGQTSRMITVGVQGDTIVEPDEGFLVTLSGATGTTIASASAEGVIRNDDPAEPGPVVTAVRVNTFTPRDQHSPAVAMDGVGNFVVAWMSSESPGDYNLEEAYGIYAQRFDAAAAPVGSEFRVNTLTAGDQQNPAVAMDSDGNFAVTWESRGQPGSGHGIYAQRYDAAGVPLGSEFRINTLTVGDQQNPAVAMDSDGNFVVTWQSWDQDGSWWEIYAQRFDAAAAPVGSEFRVNTFTPGAQQNPAVAMDSEGNFVVTWQTAGDGRSVVGGIYAQRYDASGAAVGTEFRVNSFITNNVFSPKVAMDGAGSFVVAWYDGGYGLYGWGKGGYAQRYTAAGAPVGSNLRVDGLTAVAMDDAGNFVVTWESYGQDGSGWEIHLQRFGAEAVSLPQLAISAPAPLPEGNAGGTPFAFTVTRSEITAGTSSVNWAVSGTGANPASTSDFAGGVLPSGTLTFAAGENSKTITVTVEGDTVVEPDEGFLVILSGSTGATIASATAEGVIRNDDAGLGATLPPVRARSDLTGDARSDVLVQGAGGEVGVWQMNGAAIAAGSMIASPGIYWSVIGAGDFNGNGKDDVLIRGAGGEVGAWMMDGATLLSGAIIARPGTYWSVIGTGDFDGNGKDDVLIRGAGGEVGAWMMDGATLLSGAIIARPGTYWSVIGTGDFDGNGKDDVLIRGAGGEAGVWMMDGPSLVAGTIIATPGAYWELIMG